MFSTTKTFDHRKFNLFLNFLHHKFQHSMNWCPVRDHTYLKVRKIFLQSHHNHSREPRLSKMDWAKQYPSILSFLKLNKQKIGNQKKMEAMDPRKQGLKIIVETPLGHNWMDHHCFFPKNILLVNWKLETSFSFQKTGNLRSISVKAFSRLLVTKCFGTWHSTFIRWNQGSSI